MNEKTKSKKKEKLLQLAFRHGLLGKSSDPVYPEYEDHITGLLEVGLKNKIKMSPRDFTDFATYKRAKR